MRIAWVSQKGNLTGGAELAMIEGVLGLAKQGHTVSVFSPSEGSLCRRLRDEQIRVEVLPYERWVTFGQDLTPRRKLGRLRRAWPQVRGLAVALRAQTPNVVVSNTIATAAGALAARLAGLPHVWFIHEMFGREGHIINFDWGARLSLGIIQGLSARILVNSPTTFRFYAGRLNPQRLRLVNYAVGMPDHVAPDPQGASDRFKIIQVGRLSAGKRPEDAIRAVNCLLHEAIPAHLTLIGHSDPDHEAYLRRLVIEMGLEGKVQFLPFGSPYPFVAAADVAVLCSEGESFGRVTVEAMKLGKPVVGARSGGTIDLIRDGATGLLFEPGSFDDLAAKLAQLYRDPDFRRQLGQRAQEWATRTFTVEQFTAALVSVFGELSPAAI